MAVMIWQIICGFIFYLTVFILQFYFCSLSLGHLFAFHYIDTLLQVIATHTINAVYGVSLSLVLYILPYACYTSLLLPKSYGIV